MSKFGQILYILFHYEVLLLIVTQLRWIFLTVKNNSDLNHKNASFLLVETTIIKYPARTTTYTYTILRFFVIAICVDFTRPFKSLYAPST